MYIKYHRGFASICDRIRVKELNRIDNEPLPFDGKVFSGEYHISTGLEIPYKHIVDYHK